MFKVLATGVVISKGFDNNPALKFSEKGDSVRFRVGQKVYDSRAENNTRWVNHTVKAFGSVCERIEKMQLKEGSFVNFVGRLDEDTWTDEESGEIKRMQVIILDEIEYASGGGKKDSDSGKSGAKQSAKQASPGKKGSEPENSDNFDGYTPFNGEDFFGS